MADHVGAARPRIIAILLPSLLVILVIAIAGTQRFSIQNTAGLLAPFWFRHFSSLPYQRYWEFVEAVRKVGHLIGYGLVCLAFFLGTWALIHRRNGARTEHWVTRNRAAGYALILTMLLGTLDEIHQRFVPQRTSTVTDVGFDVCGGYFALMILFWLLRWRERSSLQPH